MNRKVNSCTACRAAVLSLVWAGLILSLPVGCPRQASPNQAPVANDDSVTAAFETPTAITLSGSDPDNNPQSLRYSIVSQPGHGTLTGSPPNVTYTPGTGFAGQDSFTFEVNDGAADSDVATVSITVSPLSSQPPVANPQSVSVADNTPTAITLTANDPDNGPQALAYSIVSQPSHGSLTGSPPSVTYTPHSGYHGSDSFTFKANDGAADSNVATVSMAVGPPPQGGDDGPHYGPSDGFTRPTFPTIAGVDFTAFPPNPPRPYQPTAGGRFWYVATTGNDGAAGTADAPLASVNAAEAAAHTGDVILVADGEYTIGSDEYNALTLATPGVTLAAQNIGMVTLRPPIPTDIVAIGIAAVADNLVVDGFVLAGFRSDGIQFGRLDQPQRGLVLKHLIIDGAGDDGLRSAVADTNPNPTPVVQGLLLYDVWLRNITGVGFNCGEGPCNDVRLEALRVEMTPPAGETGSGADAVGFENGDNIVVFNAEVGGAAADGLDFKCTRVAIANVVVHDLARNGIKLWHGGDVINALVYNTGADAAVVVKVGRCRLLNSIIAYHAVGEEAYAATVGYDDPGEAGQLEVLNTIFFQNTGPLWVSDAYTLNMGNSIFFDSPFEDIVWRGIRVSDGGDSFAALESAGGGAGNRLIDPGFVAPQSGDFSLAPDSLARNSGTIAVEAFPDFDLHGQPRVQGTAVDLGPVEGP
jgi:hypothetical protein